MTDTIDRGDTNGEPSLDHLDIEEGEIATEDDFKVKRDENGDLLPVKTKVPGRDKYVVHYPISNGVGNKYLPDDYDLTKMSSAQIAGLLNDVLVRPDMDVSEDDVESGDFYAFADAQTLVSIIADKSGYDILKAQTMEMIQGNEEILQATTDGATSSER
jgi:hypothetical protein